MIERFFTHPGLRDRLVRCVGGAVPSEGVPLPPFAHPDFEAWTPVARGPTVGGVSSVRHDSWLWSRADAPDTLWLGLNEHCPPPLFVPVQDPDALVALLDRFFPRARTAESAPSRSVSVALGLVRTHADLDQRFVRDPFVAGPVKPASGAAESELVVVDSAYRTRWSRSEIAVEGWADFVPDVRVELARIRYAPAPDAEVVRTYNAAVGASWPEDVPIDVVGACHGMLGWTAEEAARQVDTSREPGRAVLLLGLILVEDPDRSLAALAPLTGHPQPGVAQSARDLSAWIRSAFQRS